MMEFSPYNEESYDEIATNIIYCKLFPLIMDDFPTRLDVEEMMSDTNLPIIVDAGITLTGVAALPAPDVKGATIAPGSGQVKSIYKGSYAWPTSIKLKAQRQAEKEAGGATLEAPITVIQEVMG